ncbi:COG3014 family protein [Anaeromyxobacter paludicola]|uniref:Lipoprotein n=1 Tax=Anaeromyxobacter paludicola TaxID=2918171 RepID=A0ABM7X9H8_9BACT|nr:hypothetical protein [Anaeromyxobacter paludicola]BDG08477.1 hypothetical protein AMPC_15900 [Anaeromyxobacter paludicola]
MGGRTATRLLPAALLLAVAAGCAGPSTAYKRDLHQQLAAGRYEEAAARIDALEHEYGERNQVLFWLDKAAVLHDAGKYAESDALLDRAELRLDALYTQSISKAAATFLWNDGADDYRGEPFERALLHVLRALNYVYLHQQDDALVEARKVSAFLTGLNDKLAGKQVYRDDAFAQYLSALLYEEAGRQDDARISRDRALKAYEWYATDYRTPAPSFAAEPLAPGQGELVLLHYNGIAPRKTSQSVQVAWNDAVAVVGADEEGRTNQQVNNALRAGIMADAITVAFPAYVQDPYQVRGSRARAGRLAVETQLVEDISAIARKALADRIAAIRVRAIARATIKFVLAKVAEKQVEERAGKGFGMLAGVLARSVAAGSEVADTRAWTTAPAEIRMARLPLPAGHHQLVVEYLSQAGAPLKVETLEVDVVEGKRSWVHVRSAF